MTKTDVSITIGALCLAAILWAAFNVLPVREGALTAVVRVDGKEIARLDLSRSEITQKTVQVPRGQATIEFGQGKARVLPLPNHVCPDGICWKTGWVSRPGQSIVCVPNHMVITVEGNRNDVDSILR